MLTRSLLILFVFLFSGGALMAHPPDEDSVANLAESARSLVLEKTITGKLSPKSVVTSGTGLFFAQNMMYRHTIAVYDRNYTLITTIRDQVRLSDYGHKAYGKNTYRGAPVEAAFSENGKYCWVSNYQMYGDSTTHPGCDGCAISEKYDKSFIYKINTHTFDIEKVIEVGAVPKYVATTPDNKYVLVSNWSSGDLSIIDVAQSKEVKRIKLGRYPRGIVVDKASKYAYIALMGSDRLVRVDLDTYEKEWITGVGKAPRHLCLGHSGRYLYASINNERRVIKIDLLTNEIVGEARTGGAPRSMVLSSNNAYLYVVNYSSRRMEKINTANMKVVEKVNTNDKPIGITFDPATNCVWVACYSGSLMVFKDKGLPQYNANQRTMAFGLTKYMKGEGFPEYKWGCYNNNGYVKYDPEREIPDAPEIRIRVTDLETAPIETAPIAEAPEPVKEKAPVVPKTVVKKQEPVKVKKEPLTVVKSSPVAASGKGYYLIGGSYGQKENAIRYEQKLIKKGYPAVILQQSNGNYMVAFGKYNDAEAADQAKLEVRAAENPKAWVYKK